MFIKIYRYFILIIIANYNNREGILKRPIEKSCFYYADFVYKDKDGNVVVEDAKGLKTEVYKIKKKLMLYRHHIQIKEV